MNRSDILNSLGIALCISCVIVILPDAMVSPLAFAVLIPGLFVIVLTGLTFRRRKRR